jgi:uncharacterized protein YxeA
LIAVLESTSGTLSRDSGEIVYRVSGMPLKYGDANFTINFCDSSFSFKVPISSDNLSLSQIVGLENAIFDPTTPRFYPYYNLKDVYLLGFQRPKILHLLAPGESGYSASVQHGYLLLFFMVNDGTDKIQPSIIDYNGYEISQPTAEELYSIYTTNYKPTSNNWKDYVLSKTFSNKGQNEEYVISFDFNSKPKSYLRSWQISRPKSLNGTKYYIYRF